MGNLVDRAPKFQVDQALMVTNNLGGHSLAVGTMVFVKEVQKIDGSFGDPMWFYTVAPSFNPMAKQALYEEEIATEEEWTWK